MPFGEFTLLSELGRGAVGVVYEAVHRSLGRTVALKVLKTGFDTHPTAIERFKREARACAQVRHDHVVEVYQAGEHEGRHYYAMALMEGQSLKQMARAGQVPEPHELARQMAGIVDALALMHDRGIVHRDIKPSNIMVEKDGRMVLADFGLARTVASDKLTMTGESLGTPLYMSPEQLLGDRDAIDGRTDVYGIGATLYEILANQPVFNAPDVGSLMRMILAERPQALREVAPDVPPALAGIVMKALEKRRRDRYHTAARLREDLLAFARGEQVKGRPVSGTVRAGRLLRRYWHLTTAAVLLLGFGIFEGLRAPAPVRLTVASIPQATLFVNGEKKGTTRTQLDVPPGEYEIVLRAEGFRERREKVTLDGNHDVERLLQPNDPTDPKALEALARSVNVEMGKWEQLSPTRSAGGDAGIHILFPRGRVLPDDAATFHLRLGEEFFDEGAIVFEADGRELYRRALNDDWPADTRAAVAMPGEVRAALAAGRQVTWGFHPAEGGKPNLATFAPAEDTKLPPALAGLEETARAQILAQLYLSRGLALRAYRLARSVAEKHQAPKAYAVMKAALEQMGFDDREHPLWRDLLELSSR
jgi:hypothetical protein